MAKIERVIGRRVWDSRGRPAVEAEIWASGDISARAIAPSSARVPQDAAQELRDGGKAFEGFGVSKAVGNFATGIEPALIGLDVRDQEAIDRRLIALDGRPDKSRLGVNVILSVSLACAKAGAKANDVALWEHVARGRKAGPMPSPVVELFSGERPGLAHAGVDIRSIALLPVDAPDFATGLDWASEIIRAARGFIAASQGGPGISDMGSLSLDANSADEALEFAVRAIERAGLSPGEDMALSVDVGGNGIGRNGRYLIGREATVLATHDMIQRALRWLRRYPIHVLTDPLAEDDLAGIAHLTELAGKGVAMSGADVLISNPARIAACAKIAAFNAVELRLSDQGTLTEFGEAVAAARQAGFSITLRAEAGEGASGDLAHFALAFGVDRLAAGGLARAERIAIWNQALTLAEQAPPKVSPPV